MDPMDKAIFLAGGVEYLIHKTPVKIVLNEMIEIAKRYGDE
jgi:transcription termination factor NusB